jgi:hypothetical protein
MMRPLLLLAIGIAAAIPPAIPTAAVAQDMINNLPDYTGAWVMGDIMQRRGRDDGGETKAPTRPESREARLERQATYAPSAAVRSNVESAFATYLGGKPPASAPALLRALAADNPPGSPFVRLLAAGLGNGEEAIRRQLRGGELQGDYARWLESMGYSDRNLFDVNTAFLMHGWSIANNGITTRYPKITFRVVRDDLIAQQDPARRAERGNDRKQEEAQSFALFTAVLVSTWGDADARERAVLSRGVAALGRRIGVDFERVTLSAEGFETQ